MNNQPSEQTPTQQDHDEAMDLFSNHSGADCEWCGALCPDDAADFMEAIAVALHKARTVPTVPDAISRDDVMLALHTEQHSKALHQEWSQVHHDTVNRICDAVAALPSLQSVPAYHCSCGATCTAEEYIDHYFNKGHDRGEQIQALEAVKAWADKWYHAPNEVAEAELVAALTPTAGEANALVDEVQRRMDAVVDAAVEDHCADENWPEASEKLSAAVESLLELRGKPEPAGESISPASTAIAVQEPDKYYNKGWHDALRAYGIDEINECDKCDLCEDHLPTPPTPEGKVLDVK